MKNKNDISLEPKKKHAVPTAIASPITKVSPGFIEGEPGTSVSHQQPGADEQIPQSGICCTEDLQTSHSPSAHTKGRLAKTAVVPIASIEFDPKQADENLVSQLTGSLSAPWGQLLTPVLVSRLPETGNGKYWLLRRGASRLVTAQKLNFQNITVSIVEGTEAEIKLLVLESKKIRRQLNVYQQMQNHYEWDLLVKAAHGEYYKPGGNKAKKAIDKKANAHPMLNTLIELHTGHKKTAFYTKIDTFKELEPTVVRPFLEQHPNLLTARNEQCLIRLSKYKPEEQKKLVPHLLKYPQPQEAFFKACQEKAELDAANLPDDELFPVDHEDFRVNAERFPNHTAKLILVDPNWFLAEDKKQGQFWMAHGEEIAPQLTKKDWEEFFQLAAQKLHPDGHMALLIGQQCFCEITDILRKHFNVRWLSALVHGSGSGTPSRKAYIASHWRPIVLCRRKDAPPLTDQYTKFIHDLVPEPSALKSKWDPEALLGLLKAERQELDAMIAEFEATGEDPSLNDVIFSLVRKSDMLKKFHPWAQSVGAFRKIIQDFTQPGDFVWDPFIGSGTTGIAAVTCKTTVLKDGKRVKVPAPRVGRGCDAMELWAKVAKCRIWAAQHPEDPTSSFFVSPADLDDDYKEKAK